MNSPYPFPSTPAEARANLTFAQQEYRTSRTSLRSARRQTGHDLAQKAERSCKATLRAERELLRSLQGDPS